MMKTFNKEITRKKMLKLQYGRWTDWNLFKAELLIPKPKNKNPGLHCFRFNVEIMGYYIIIAIMDN